jgi:hypothetical protein
VCNVTRMLLEQHPRHSAHISPCKTMCGFLEFLRPVLYRVKSTWQGSFVSYRTLRGPFVMISVVVREALIGVRFDATHLSESYTSGLQWVQGVGPVYSGADKSLARPTTRFSLFDG